MKRNRTPAPFERFQLGGFLLTRSTWLFVGAVFLLAYGTSAMMYSRWDHAYNRTVHPVFHPWAILLGLAAIVIAFRMRDN